MFRGSKPLTIRNASRKGDVGAASALETDEQTAKRRKSNREHVRETRVLQNVQIVGVPQLHSYNACLQCKARVEPLTPPLEDAPNMTVA